MILVENLERLLLQLGEPGQVLRRLSGKHKIYLVGGTIRDIVIGRIPADYDFAVAGAGIRFARELAKAVRGKFILLSEPADQARVVCRRSLILDFNGFGSGTITDDLARRDFTMNAIAYSVVAAGSRGTLVDPFSGLQAIRQKRLIPVSERSLTDDPLRLLRAIRFALELGFKIDPKIRRQAQEVSLSQVAAERIGYELLRIMDQDGSSRYLSWLYRTGFLRQLFPELARLIDNRLLMRHSLLTYRKLEELIHRESYFRQYATEFQEYFAVNAHNRALLKLAALFHDAGKPDTESVNERNEVHFYGHDALGAKYVRLIARRRLRLSRVDTRTVELLVGHHMRPHLLAGVPELTDRAIRRYLRDTGAQYFGLMMLAFADGYATAGKTRHLEEQFARMIQLKRQLEATIRVQRLVTGDDLIALGMKPGPIFKVVLNDLEELQIAGRIRSKEEGIEYVRKMFVNGQGNALFDGARDAETPGNGETSAVESEFRTRPPSEKFSS